MDLRLGTLDPEVQIKWKIPQSTQFTPYYHHSNKATKPSIHSTEIKIRWTKIQVLSLDCW